MSKTSAEKKSSPLLVALLSWLFPGLGYLALGQKVRALTVGVSVTSLFAGGLLLGGLRCMEVPGYGVRGGKLWVWTSVNKNGQSIPIESETPPDSSIPRQWVLTGDPLHEIRDKPWAVVQVMMGPLDLAANYLSVWAARPTSDAPGAPPRAPASHARVNEIGVLYTAIAGLLNLLAIIDAWHRADLKAGDEK